MTVRFLSMWFLAMTSLSLASAGCGGADSATTPAEAVVATVDHSGWWCVEHGVPEEECPRCDARLVAKFKAQGDWCEDHNRPDSQCFVCHPEHQERFAARYAARYGKQPPMPTE